ncbi:MAG: nickel-dependent hydrogenase large subunit, partial [Thermoplasmata archaeon]|nr:nickel-dependent hydrogenase large subunit [Thermoplasmata archaeon]
VAFSQTTQDIFADIVRGNSGYVELIQSDAYRSETHYMSLVNDDDQLDVYGGHLRVVSPEGEVVSRFHPSEYLDHIAERVEPWSYMKFPYLKRVGWKGFTDGMDSGCYRVGPLGRVNAADGMATPLAQKEYDRMFESLGGKPIHSTLAFHWARLVELLYATGRTLELVLDEDITSDHIRNPVGEPGEGFGVIEAARGTLFHHYKVDKQGLIEKANLIVATTNNAGAITMSVRDAAKGLIKNGEVNDGLLNMVEMAFRAYDPCFGCATHCMPGDMPLIANIYDRNENLLKTIRRD